MNNYEDPGIPSERRDSMAQTPGFNQSVRSLGVHALVRIVIRRLRWFIGSVLIFEILALIITARTMTVYEATATIELNQSSGASLSEGLGELASQQFGEDEDSLLVDQQTETAILEGDSLALAVIDRLGLASQPPFAAKGSEGLVKRSMIEESPKNRTRLLSMFKGNLKVSPARGTRLIRVSYESHDPKQAAEIANALIDTYKYQYLQSHYEATSQTSAWLTKQLADLKANVEDSEKKLTDFEKQSGIINLNVSPSGAAGDSAGEGQIHSVVIQKLDTLNDELTRAEANRIEKEAIYRLVQTGNSDVIQGLGKDPLAVQSNSTVLTEGGGISNLQQLRQQENELKVNLAEASTTYGANNRHLKEMQTQLQALDEQIHQELQRIAQRAQADFQLAQQTESGIHRQFEQQQLAANDLNEKTVQFAVLSQEAASRKRLYEDLYTKLQEANVSAGIKATNITIVDPAREPSLPIRPQRRTNMALGLLFGVFFGLAAAIAVESFDRTVGDPMEVEEITGKPVIGVIPSFGAKSRIYGAREVYSASRRRKNREEVKDEPPNPGSVWILDHPESAAAEAFRSLRTSIMLSRVGGGPKIILLTSCTPGEGKTTVTLNLAVAFALQNKKVIVVEADLRRPGIESRFNVSKELGLSNVLVGSCTADAATHHGVYVPTLDIMPAGPRPPLPAELLGSTAFDDLLKDLRSRYNIVLIDSPPAFLVTDAVSISLKTDAVIWVAQADVVTRPYLARAYRLIARDGMPVIGFVVNRMNRSVAGYGYGYEYEHAHTYYGEDDAK